MKYYSFISVIEIFFLCIFGVDLRIITENLFMQNEELLENLFNDSTKTEFTQVVKRSLVTANRRHIWDEGIIPYEIDDVYTGLERKIIKQAMQHWEQLTCIKFIHRIERLHKDYVFFTKTDCGCCSAVGKRGKGKQIISLQNNCLHFGIIVHELGHAIGFYHEHQRPDRDDYIEILYDNISEDNIYNFEKRSRDKAITLGQAYDLDSIMHYGNREFAKNDFVSTIKAKPQIDGSKPILGERSVLSQVDIETTQRLYNCRRCGETFTKPEGTIRPPVYPNDSNLRDESCEWTIKLAEGQEIRLSVKLFGLNDNNSCAANSLEIRTSHWRNTDIIAEYCQNVDTVVITDNNIVVIRLRKMHYENNNVDFILEYNTLSINNIFVRSNGTSYLESPNYPGSYVPNEVYFWEITAPDNHFISIKFYHFDIENSRDCKNDAFESEESDNHNPSVTKKYCGQQDNLTIFSQGPSMLVKFRSNELINADGFSAAIKALPITDNK